MRESRFLILTITFLVGTSLTSTIANATPPIQSVNESNLTEESSYVPGELIVTLKETDTPSISENIDFHNRMINAIPDFKNSVKWESAPLHTSLIKVKVGEELAQIKALKQNPNVESVELNTIQYERGHIISTDPNFSSQWHLNATNAPGSWHYTTGSPNIIVAVIDTGIEWTHSDLSSGIWNNTDDSCTGGVDNDSNGKVDDCRGWDFVNNDNNPIDDRDHGTFVAGIIGARLNTVFGASMAPNVSLMPIKALSSSGGGSEVNVIKGIEYAVQNGAHVINMSLGAYGACSVAMQNAVNLANNNGVVFVVSAGQPSPGQDIQDMWPSCDHVISVTATDNFNYSSHYADWTGTTDLAAPGGDTPSLVVHGGHTSSLPIASTYLNNTFGTTVLNNLGQPVPSIGTSFAAPLVSGCAALMKTLDSTFSADFIESKMEESALDLIDSGYIPNNATAGKDKVFGWGLLQCDAALRTTAPVISLVVPINGSSVNQFNVSYSLNEVVSSGTITFTGTSGTDLGVVHTYNFAVGDKTAGPHIISKTNLETGFASPLVSGSGYTMTISVTDTAASSMSISVSKTLITYTNPPGICPTPTVPWVIESGCKIVSQVNPSGNVDVQNGAIVTIDPTGTLNIDSLTKHLKIHYGSGIIIKSGGKIN